MSKAAASRSKRSGQPLRLLIVEDSPADAELCVATLKRAGYHVTFDLVGSPASFRQRLEQADYDLILADHNLSTWLGTQALEILIQMGREVPFVVVTAALGDEAAVEYIKCGATDYVLKHRLDRLPAVVGRCLRDQAHREQAERLQEQIRSAKEEWERTFDSVSDAVLLLDGQCRIRRANRAARALVGVDAAQLIGKHFHEVLYGTTERPPDCPCERVLRTGEEQCTDVYQRRQDKTLSVSATPLRDRSGVLCGCVLALHDITARKRAEETLRESEQRYRDLTESTSDWIWEVDANGFYIYASPKVRDLLGYELEEVIGKTPFDFMPPDEAKRVGTQFAAIVESRQPFWRLENTNLRKDGRLAVLETSGVPVFDDTGHFHGYRGIDRDITARRQAEDTLRQSEERFRTIFQGAAEGILVADIGNKKFVFANPAVCRMLGYTEAELVQMGVGDIHPQQDLERVIAEFTAQAHGEKTLASAVPCLRKDGTTIYADITATRAVIDGRDCNVGFFSDVTERRQLEKQLIQAQKMEAVGRLSGGVAHDFNNLLTIIDGYSDLVLEGMSSGDPLARHVEEIKKAGARAASLTRQLLAFGRRQVLAPQVLDVNASVADVDKMLRRLIGEDIKFRTVLHPALCRVRADPSQIEQVVMNLAVNARDAMPEGGLLTIETANIELDAAYARSHAEITPGPYVMLAVSDTGIGMDAETQAHLFEPFFTTKEKGKGTGLGLATVYGIVKQSGGHISVYSEPDRGTTFKIYLPRVEEVGQSVRKEKPRGEVPRGSEIILLVEDEEGVLALAQTMLEAQGYTVLAASNPEEAVPLAEQRAGRIDLLLTDVVMPQMGGRRLAEYLMFSRPEMKVLYMSGYTDDTIVQHRILEPGIAFLQKPFTLEALARKVREVLDAGAEASARQPGQNVGESS